MEITIGQWGLLVVGAAGIGIAKSGFTGLTFLHILVFAFVFGPLESTGVLLPLLIVGDISSVFFYGRNVDWVLVRRVLPPAMIGVLFGWAIMARMDETMFRSTIGIIILGLTAMQTLRITRPGLMEHAPGTRWFGVSMGLIAGVATMMANAAGPIIALYLLAVSMKKLELVGTSAWFFLLINFYKLPFSYSLGLIDVGSLGVDLILAPAVVLGMLIGQWMLNRIPQKWFDLLLLVLTAMVAIRLTAGF